MIDLIKAFEITGKRAKRKWNILWFHGMLSTKIWKLYATKHSDFSLAFGKGWVFLQAAAFLQCYWGCQNTSVSIRRALEKQWMWGVFPREKTTLIRLFLLWSGPCVVSKWWWRGALQRRSTGGGWESGQRSVCGKSSLRHRVISGRLSCNIHSTFARVRLIAPGQR